MARPPRDYHPLAIAVVELWARSSGYDPGDVWTWLTREAPPPPEALRDILSALYPVVRAEDFDPLPSGSERAINRHMGQASLSRYRAGRTVGRPIVSEHPFPRALAAANVTVTEWAEDHEVGRSHVKSWFLDGAGGRPIPRRFAESIRKEFGVPMTAWKHGITD